MTALSWPVPGVVAPPPQPAKPDRTRFLGGSDVAAVMGLSPWETPVELWQEKCGLRPPSTEIDHERERRFRRGHKLEPFIREMVIEKLQDQGMRVELLACNERYQDATYPFLACEIDFELRLWGEAVVGEHVLSFDGADVNADAKSVSGFARMKWGVERNTDVPIEYACQFMHGLGIRSRQVCLVAALRSFDDVDIYWTEADADVIAAMRARCVEFWTQHVLPRVPPDPLNFSDVKILWPREDGSRREADEALAAKVDKLRLLRARQALDKIAEEGLCFEVGRAIEPAAELAYKGRVIATWKSQGDTRLDQKAIREEEPDLFVRFCRTKTIRVLRLPKPRR